MNTKRNYLLLTPGPLSTSETVREAMLQDWCTWDKDYNEGIVTPIRKGLLAIAGLDEDEYTDVLLQGSGTYCVEATIGAAVKPTDKLLILANGAYGKRMAQIAEYYHIDHVLVSLHETELVTGEVARKALEANPDITHLSMVQDKLIATKGNARSLSLDIYAQWETMEKGGGKWRFTSPTHVVHAFYQAMKELNEEGGIVARSERYKQNHRTLVDGMRALGFKTLLPDASQGPIITSFLYPTADFDFHSFYDQLKAKGFVIYPGKISDADTFRIGNIGDIFPDDMEALLQAIRSISY